MRGLIVSIVSLFIFITCAIFLWLNETRRKTILTGRLDKYWNLKERRKFVRIPKRLEVVCEFAKKSDSNWSLFTKNISGEGICIYTPEILPEAAIVDLRIRIPEREELSVKGSVVWVREAHSLDEQGRKQFNAGIKLTDINSKDKRRFVGFIAQTLKGFKKDKI